VARVARIVIPGIPHHITQRGNNRQEVFLSPDNYKLYMSLLAYQSARYGLRIAGYCLMPNHIHIIGIPAERESLAKAIGRTHFHYAQHFNRVHHRDGHVWQNRFFSCALDESHFIAAMAYIERNPSRTGLVGKPWDYEWSSAAGHLSVAPPDILDTEMFDRAMSPAEWKAYLLNEQPASMVHAIRSNTHTGRPAGDDKFLSVLEKRLGVTARALPVGRPGGADQGDVN
jgi:putative transposase